VGQRESGGRVLGSTEIFWIWMSGLWPGSLTLNKPSPTDNSKDCSTLLMICDFFPTWWWCSGERYSKIPLCFFGALPLLKALSYHLILTTFWLLQSYLQKREEPRFRERLGDLSTQQSTCSEMFSRNNTLTWISSLLACPRTTSRNHSWGGTGQTRLASSQKQRTIWLKD
jgi:hypothetical protein